MKLQNTLIVAATLAALGTTGAIAQGAQMGGSMSRDEVVAELRAAQAAGWQSVQEVSPTPLEAAEEERNSFSLGNNYGYGTTRDQGTMEQPRRPGMTRDNSTMQRGSGDPAMRSPNQDETRSLQNVPNQEVPTTPR